MPGPQVPEASGHVRSHMTKPPTMRNPWTARPGVATPEPLHFSTDSMRPRGVESAMAADKSQIGGKPGSAIGRQDRPR